MKFNKNKKEVTCPIYYLPLSQIKNPLNLLKKPGDFMKVKVNKNNSKTAVVHADGVKRSITQYPTGRKVETISYD